MCATQSLSVDNCWLVEVPTRSFDETFSRSITELDVESGTWSNATDIDGFA